MEEQYKIISITMKYLHSKKMYDVIIELYRVFRVNMLSGIPEIEMKYELAMLVLYVEACIYTEHDQENLIFAFVESFSMQSMIYDSDYILVVNYLTGHTF